MNEDSEKSKPKQKHPNSSLNIPDPVELLKYHALKRPPSVRILSRRLSGDSSNHEEILIRHSSKPSFKKARRRSVPDQIEKKPEKTHRKCDSKSKLIQKPNESRPPLAKKSSKLIKPEVSKLLCRDNNVSAPHLRKHKKVIHRIDIPCPVSMTEDKRKTEVHTPSKIIKKLTDLKKIKNKELKKIEKEIIHKTSNSKVLKYEKQIKHHRNENKSMQLIVKTRPKSKTPAIITDETPMKYHRKNQVNEKIVSSLVKGKNERQKSPADLRKVKKVKEKKNKVEKENEKISKGKVKTHVKKKSNKFSSQDKWINHSFCNNQNDSQDIDDQFKNSGNQTSNVPSTNCNFLSPPVEKTNSKNSSDSTINFLTEKQNSYFSPPRKVKIYKKSDFANLELNKKEKAAVKIQAWVRGFITREKYRKLLICSSDDSQYGLCSDEEWEKRCNKDYVYLDLVNTSEENYKKQLKSGSKVQNHVEKVIRNESSAKVKPKSSRPEKKLEKAPIILEVNNKNLRKNYNNLEKYLKNLEASDAQELQSFDYEDSLVFDSQSQSENAEYKQIIEEMQKPEISSFEEGFPEFIEEVIDKSDTQAPRPCEIASKTKSPSFKAGPIALSEFSRRIKLEQKNLEEVEKSFKEIEEFENLEMRKGKKLAEGILNKDLEGFNRIEERTDPEGHIVEIFRNIFSEKYEQLYSMFDDNIKAVKEALANTVISDESIANKIEEQLVSFCQDYGENNDFGEKQKDIKTEDQDNIKKEELQDANPDPKAPSSLKLPSHQEKFFKNLEKCASRLPSSRSPSSTTPRASSPELIKTLCEFPTSSSPILQVFKPDPSPLPSSIPSDQPIQSSNQSCSLSPGSIYQNIFWVDEVAMPSSLDFSHLITDSVICELEEQVFQDTLLQVFYIDSNFLLCLSEEIIQALLKNEIEEEQIFRKSQLNEDTIFSIIQKIFSKTQSLIVAELLKPLERDPLIVLSEIQETEIGAGFFVDEKYAMLNIEAFKDDLETNDKYLAVFNSVVFDCINDCLEILIVKEDLPWALTKYKKTRVRTPEQVVHYIVDRLVKFNEVRAGMIGFSGNESQVARQRDLDTVKIMTTEVEDNEENWTRYEKEETQSALDIADLILEVEIEGLIEIIFKTG